MDAHALQPDQPSWFNRNRWRLGFALLAVIGGVWFRHRRRGPDAIDVGAVSERWLAEQAFQAGQRPAE